jgi:hypothetical protein
MATYQEFIQQNEDRKANKVLGFLRINISKCPQDIKEKAYLTLVRPHLEYSSAVWDPYRK